MKKILLVLTLILGTLVSNSQEFIGIKVDGKKDVVINAFKSKGFFTKGNVDESKNVITLYGSAAGKSVELVIFWTPISKIVWKYSVYLPEQSSWTYLKSDYENYLKVLSEKYGEPEKKYNFFSSPYNEGDGYEMTGVYAGKSNYASFWKQEQGISLQITKWKQVRISYENYINSQLDDRETNQLNAKAF